MFIPDSRVYQKQSSQKTYSLSLDALPLTKDCTFHVIWGIVHKDLLYNYRRRIKLKTSQSNELCDPI